MKRCTMNCQLSLVLVFAKRDMAIVKLQMIKNKKNMKCMRELEMLKPGYWVPKTKEECASMVGLFDVAETKSEG